MKNSEDKVYMLSLGMYGVLFKNSWQIKVELYDGRMYNGTLKNHNTTTSPYKVIIVIETKEGQEIHIDLCDVKEIS